MTKEELKQKRIEYIQEMILKYTTTEPELEVEEVLWACCYNLSQEHGIENIIKKLRKELKNNW